MSSGQPVAGVSLATTNRRKDFEEWMGDGGLSPRAIERNSKGDYIFMQAASAWEVWKAAHAKPAAPAEDGELLATGGQPQADALDAELLDWLEGEVCNSYTGVTITRIDHREEGMVIERGFRLRRFHKDYEVKPTLRAAIAATKENP